MTAARIETLIRIKIYDNTFKTSLRRKWAKVIFVTIKICSASHIICCYQEPIKWSLHLPYNPLESTLSRVDLQLERFPGETSRADGGKRQSQRRNDTAIVGMYFIKQQEIRCWRAKNNHIS